MWEQAWLTYRPEKNRQCPVFFQTIFVKSEYLSDVVIQSGLDELLRAGLEMYNVSFTIQNRDPEPLELGLWIRVGGQDQLGNEGYEILEKEGLIELRCNENKGVLYGIFRLLEIFRTGEWMENLHVTEIPKNEHRMLNHWDNLDGSIERGYAGNSFFFKNGQILTDQRTLDYARLLASIYINGVVINNVNVKEDATLLITDKYLTELDVLCSTFHRYGIKLFISINFAAPMEIGNLETCDPNDELVVNWWMSQCEKVFNKVPKLGGFLVKADSEGRPGPFTYHRTQAEGANMLAKAIAPYGGILIWRCFVYNCQQDWRDYTLDRAKASYEAFMPLDGLFDTNVVLQIKNGPMDFQVREPVSPLLGAMKSTNQFLEFQITQEYSGQQKHICYLVPQWKEVLEFKTYHTDENDQIKDIVSGKTYHRNIGGITAVSNTGDEPNWTGHDFAGANLFGFGKLAWDVDNSAESIAQTWTRLTFGNTKEIEENVCKMLGMSYRLYEKYTTPMGIGWMVNPNHHYGPNVDGYEYDRWGTYHRANWEAIGVDRTSLGTGYTLQYHPKNQIAFDSLTQCPMELSLFFHRIRYTTKLNNGKTLLQHWYDEHFEGMEEVKELRELWTLSKQYIDDYVFERVDERLKHQEEHAKQWCDVLTTYFYRKSGIVDVHHRGIVE